MPRSELGGATATAAFFRSLGSALGVALSGALLASHLQVLPDALRSVGAGASGIAGLPPAQREMLLAAYRTGLSHAFVTGAVVASLGLLVVLLLPERPLRSTIDDPAPSGQPARS